MPTHAIWSKNRLQTLVSGRLIPFITRTDFASHTTTNSTTLAIDSCAPGGVQILFKKARSTRILRRQRQKHVLQLPGSAALPPQFIARSHRDQAPAMDNSDPIRHLLGNAQLMR